MADCASDVALFIGDCLRGAGSHMGYVTGPMRRRASDILLSIFRDDEYDAVWNRLREVRPQMSRSELRHHTIYHLRHETGFWERALEDNDIPVERARRLRLQGVESVLEAEGIKGAVVRRLY